MHTHTYINTLQTYVHTIGNENIPDLLKLVDSSQTQAEISQIQLKMLSY
jgi:hypothetical protein